MTAFRLKLAAIALVSALSASAAHAQPSLFAKQGRTAAAAPAYAQVVQPAPGRVAITQQGRGNGAAVSQNGPANNAAVNQKGLNNEGQISQNGANNSAAIHQLGQNNSGAIVQNGSNNDACLVQLGRNNAAGLTQNGDGNAVGIAQNAVRAWEFSPELCRQYGDNPVILKRMIRGAGLPPAKG